MKKLYVEECFVIEEKVQHGDRKLRAGKYRRRSYTENKTPQWCLFYNGRWHSLGGRDSQTLEKIYESSGLQDQTH